MLVSDTRTFLAARSRWITFLDERYSIPLATWSREDGSCQWTKFISVGNLITEWGQIPGGEFLAGAVQVSVVMLGSALTEELLQLSLGDVLHDHVGRLCGEKKTILVMWNYEWRYSHPYHWPRCSSPAAWPRWCAALWAASSSGSTEQKITVKNITKNKSRKSLPPPPGPPSPCWRRTPWGSWLPPINIINIDYHVIIIIIIHCFLPWWHPSCRQYWGPHTSTPGQNSPRLKIEKTFRTLAKGK